MLKLALFVVVLVSFILIVILTQRGQTDAS